MMRALDRKLVRDLGRMKFQAAAIALVVASGMTLFVGTAATSRALSLSEEKYYDDHRFAHVWSRLTRAPQSVVDGLRIIPGVTAVEGRLVAQGILDLPTIEEPATGLFVGIPPRHGHALNDVYLRRGRHVEANGQDEALVSEAFADRIDLRPGDVVRAVIAGRQVMLRVVGVALSPEFLMQIAPGGLIPDDRRFGVFWVARDRLEHLLDLDGAVNEVALRLAPGANDTAVIRAVDRVLEPYGGQGAYGRTSQPSHVMLEDHITPLNALAALVPGVFLTVAMFLLNVVLSRLVSTERTQIGMLKAFGYSNARLARHYLLFALTIVAGGVVIGVPAGIWLGRVMATWFAAFFRFPELVFRTEPSVIAIGALVMIGGSALGALGTLANVIRMPPSVAMAPAAPLYRPTFVDRMGLLIRALAPATRMILRSVTRRPLRAALTAAGMSAAIAIVIMGSFISDAMNRVVDIKYQAQERQDMSVVLAHARSLEQWSGVAQLPGVRVAEPYRAVSARLHAAGATRDVVLIGLTPSSRLRRIVDATYRQMSVPPDGVVVSKWLAARANLKHGELVAIEIREDRRRIVTARVATFVQEPLGTYLYMDLNALGRLLNEPNTFRAFNLLVDPARAGELYAALKNAPEAVGVDFRRTAIANFRAMADESIDFIRQIEVFFAVIIAFGVVYNAARIAVAERAYELATLRVLGFTRQEISTVLLGEIGLLAIPAIPLGCFLGYALSARLAAAAASDLFRFPVVVTPATYVFAVVVFSAAVLGAALVVRRRLDRLDLVAVLKARE